MQVEGEQKKLVGGLGAIEKMLFIIREKLKAGVSIVVLILKVRRKNRPEKM